MLPCSKAGSLYSIDVETVNAGIPYADSFYVHVHYCIHKISDTQSSIEVYAQIKYKKSVWGLVKGMIEKNVWIGLDDFFSSLAKALQLEAEESGPAAVKRKSRRRRRLPSAQRQSSEEAFVPRGSIVRPKQSLTVTRRLLATNFVVPTVFIVLVLLIVLNILLYYKLWSLEEAPPPNSILDLQVLKDPPKNHDEWIQLLRKQETLHSVEMQKWQKMLTTAIQLLKRTEDSLNELQKAIHPSYTKKIMSIVESSREGAEQLQRADQEL